MKVRLIGCGAVGAPLSVRLYNNCDFALLCDDRRRATLIKDGICVNGVQYLFPVDDKPSTDVDLIILAVKNFSLSNAIEVISPYVGKNTTILSLLNGVESEEILEKAFPFSHVLYGFITSLSSNRSNNTVTCFSANGGIIYFGEKDGSLTPYVVKVKELFDYSNVTYKLSRDIKHDMWWKFMLNTCFNSLSAILGTPYSKIYNNEALLRAARMIASEVQIAANIKGVTLTSDDIDKMMETMLSFTDDGKTSMLQDVEAGRATENRYFAKAVVKIAHEKGINLPLSEFVYNLVEAASYAKK